MKMYFDRSRRNKWHPLILHWHSQDTGSPSCPLRDVASYVQDRGGKGFLHNSKQLQTEHAPMPLI